MQLDTLLNVLHGVLSLPIGWLSSILPGHGVANAAWTLLATMLITSTLASLGRHQLFMFEHMTGSRGAEKLKERLEVKRSRVDYQSRDEVDKAINRAARVAFMLRNCANLIRRCIEPFGGYFLSTGWPSFRSIFTIGNIAFAAIAVNVGWPSTEDRDKWYSSMRRLYEDYISQIGDISFLVAIIVVFVTLGVFIGRAPMIDHVRARSDASAEANSRMLRISASIYDLYLELGLWQRELSSGIGGISDEVIRDASDSRFEWFGREIRRAHGLRWRGGSSHSSADLEASAETLNDELREMRAAGVGLVAARLAATAGDHLEHAGISLSHGREGARFLFTKLWFREAIERRVASNMPIFWRFESIDEDDFKLGEFDRLLEQSARELRESEIQILYEQELRSLHLYRACNLLERRKMGSLWVRILSARYGK